VKRLTKTILGSALLLFAASSSCSDETGGGSATPTDAGAADAIEDAIEDASIDDAWEASSLDASTEDAAADAEADAGIGDASVTDAQDAAPDTNDDAANDAATCTPSMTGTGLVSLTAPTFSAAISTSVPVFRTLTDHGKMHYPDGAVTLRNTGADWEVYLASGRESYRLTGGSPTAVTLNPTTPVLAPTGSTSDPHHGYAGVTSVTSCGGTLTAFFHAEYHAIPVTPWPDCPAPYHASMARATAAGGGSTLLADTPPWVLTSSGTASYGAPKCAYGAGGGSVFDPGGDFLYMYYYDWDAPNGIYLARTCRSDCGGSGMWRKYVNGEFTGEAFSASFLDPSGPSTPLISAGGAAFDAFPVVSRNNYLNAYLMITATESGYALRVSADGVTWGDRIDLLQHLDAADGRINVYYPTLVDAQTWSRDETGRNLKLIHAIVADDEGRPAPHRAFLADIELTKAGTTKSATFDRRTLVRYFNNANPFDHWCTTSSTGYPVEGNLGILAANSLPGTRPLYDCLIGGKDHLVSLRSDCEGGTTLGILGFAWTSAGPGRHAIHRCSMASPEGGVDHLVSVDASCEGLTPEGILGYVE